MKNSELTYKEIYGQPASFQAINDTLEDIYQVLDQVFAEKYDELIFTGCGTSLYLAQAAAHGIDLLKLDHVIGTIAGDDTIFVAVESKAYVPELIDAFKALL